jgi:hypothetical protein
MLSVFNLWLIVQVLSVLRYFRGYSSAIQIAHGTFTLLFCLLWI